MCFVGPKVKGQEFLQAISSWDGERCLLNEVDEKSFLHQQDSVAQVLRGKGEPWNYFNIPGSSYARAANVVGNKWFIRSALISSLPDDIVNKTVLQFADTPVGCSASFSRPRFRSLMDFSCPQRGCSNWPVARLSTLRIIAYQRHNVRLPSTLPRCINGILISRIRAVSIPQRR
jgi:hypothetical protein